MARPPSPPSPFIRRFGRYMRQLREARDLTQAELARRCGLAPDTISRLETGAYGPNLVTLAKMVEGLRIDFEGLFAGFERNDAGGERELLALVRGLSPAERRAGVRVLVVLAGVLGSATDRPEPEDA